MNMTHNFHHIETSKSVRSPATSVLAKLFNVVAANIRAQHNRRKTKEMLYLSDHVLDDIGLSRSDIVDALSAGPSRDTAEVLKQRRSARCAELIARKSRVNSMV